MLRSISPLALESLRVSALTAPEISPDVLDSETDCASIFQPRI